MKVESFHSQKYSYEIIFTQWPSPWNFPLCCFGTDIFASLAASTISFSYAELIYKYN
jgi:hypothetical protein